LDVNITLEVQAEIPAGALDHVVRTVTENIKTLKSRASPSLCMRPVATATQTAPHY